MSIRRRPLSSLSDDTLPDLMSRRSVDSEIGAIATASLIVSRAIVIPFLSESYDHANDAGVGSVSDRKKV